MKDYEVVISGISGCFPGDNDVEGLRNQLYDTKDDNIITLDPKGFFENGDYDKPEFMGPVNPNFDYENFGLSCFLQTDFDSNVGFVLERSYEAIVDAGLNPLDLKGCNHAVVVSLGSTDNERMIVDENPNRYQVISSSKAMSANRISFHYGLTGPSFNIYGSLESGLTALDVAARLVAKGTALAVIVASSHFIDLPQNFWHGGEDAIPLLSPDGKTRSFSQNASGFAWSEGSVALFLQRKEHALRSYGKIEKSMISSMLKQKSNIYSDMKLFMRDFYDNVDFDPEEIAYIEADGLGIPELDQMELEGLLESVCRQRRSSLPVSCCKSKLGNSYVCSSLVSVVHSLLASQESHIPPTLHYCPHQTETHPSNDPRIKIVTEKTPAKGCLYGVSSFGLGAVACHVVIRQNDKSRQPSDILGPEDPPALIFISGRDKLHIEKSLERFSSSTNDRGYVALVHRVFRRTNQFHVIRGFAITNSPVPVIPIVEVCDYVLPPVWFMFSGMGSQWNRMGTDLLKLPFTAASLRRSHQVLLSKNIDLISIITSTDPHIHDDITNSFVGIAAIQVALVDLLWALGIKPDGIIGHSVGELGCGYADGCLTAEQTILSAYARGRASKETTLIKGMMAAIGRGNSEMKNSLPSGIEVACHNSSSSCTLSGPTELVEKYVDKLKKDGVFAKAVNVANIAYHSKYIAPAGPLLLKYMKEIIVKPVERSSKWLSTSTEESHWDEAKMCSAEYYTNNLLKPVLFEEAAKHIPEGALVIEIAPHGLLQAIVKRSHPNCFNVPLTSRTAANNLVHLLEALGRIYLLGINMDLSSMYPEVSFPVPRETKSLTSFISWDHSERETLKKPVFKSTKKLSNEYLSCKSEEALMMKQNYVIGGEAVTPLSFLLEKIISVLAQQRNLSENGYLEFKDVTIHSLLQVPLNGDVNVAITLLGGGEFFIFIEEDIQIVSGVIYEDTSKTIDNLIKEGRENHTGLFLIQQEEIYSLLENIGYRIGGPLKNIEQMELSSSGFIANISLQDGSKYILDSMILSMIFHTYYFTGKLCSLESFGSLFLQKARHASIENKGFVTMHYSVMTGAVSCDGMFLSSIKFKTCSTPVSSQLNMTQLSFLPTNPTETMKLDDFCCSCIQVVCQEVQDQIKKMFIMEVDRNYLDQNKIVNLLSIYSKQVQFKTLIKEELVSLTGVTPEENNDCSWMVVCTANSIPDEIVQVCQKSNNNFALILTDKQYPLGGMNEMECLIKFEQDNVRAHLLKKKQTVQINESTVVDTSNTEWKQQVKNLVKSGSPKDLYFVSHISMYSEVMATHRQCCNSIQMQNLRFVFYDDSCPKFDLKSSFYRSHLEKGFKVNVCQASKWGHNVHFPTQICFEENNNEIILDNISSDLVSLECLSFHPEEKLSCRVVEYEGKADNIRVIGVGTLENEILRADPVLHWKYPQSWNVEEACTVPIFYSMAYYMISVMAKLKDDSMVLILGADSPAGEAAIRVALSTGASVSVVCSSQENMHAIKQIFPQLDKLKVYLIQRNTMLADIEKMTSGVGCQLVINFLSDIDSIKISTRCMAERRETDAEQRFYFQISKDPMETNLMFGQETFLRGVSLMSCNPELIVNLIYEKRIKVRDCVEQGIKTGVVKSFKYIHLSRPLTRYQLSSTTQKYRNNFVKFVVSLNEGNNSSSQSAKRKKSHLFIGNGDLYFNMLYSLMSQSNEVIHLVFSENSMSPSQLKRLSTVVQSSKNREICLHSFSKLSTASSSEAFVRKLQKDYYLEKAVIMAQGLPNEAWSGLEQLGGECRVCLVGVEAEGWCQARIRQGYPTVCLVPEANLPLSSFLPLLVALHSSCSDAQGIYSIQQPSANTLGSQSELLPADKSELLELAHSLSDDICFTEISTKCSPYVTSNQVLPIFLLPGFRRMQIQKLAHKLNHPAFIASWPKQLPSFHQLASQLKQCLTENFHQNIYTLVCEGWTVILASKLAQLLGEDGKECQIFVLGQSFSQIQKSLNEFSMSKLIKKYFPLADIKKDGSEEITEMSLSEITLCERNLSMGISNTIHLKECLIHIADAAFMVSKVNQETIQHCAYVTNIRPFMTGELFRSPDLEKMCKRRVFVQCVDTKETFQSEKLAGIISDCVFHELPGFFDKQNLYKQQETVYFDHGVENIKQVRSLF